MLSSEICLIATLRSIPFTLPNESAKVCCERFVGPIWAFFCLAKIGVFVTCGEGLGDFLVLVTYLHKRRSVQPCWPMCPLAMVLQWGHRARLGSITHTHTHPPTLHMAQTHVVGRLNVALWSKSSMYGWTLTSWPPLPAPTHTLTILYCVQ